MGEYYLKNNGNKRLFAGLGVGTFSVGNITLVDSSGVESKIRFGNAIGITPRVGYELGLIRLVLEYNYTFDRDVPNYLGIKLGLNVGGRHKGLPME